MAFSPDIARLIAAAAQSSGLADRYPGFMEKMAQIESGGDPGARNASGAAGLFQFMPKTAQAYSLSDPYNPEASARAAAQLTLDNAGTLSRRLGRQPSAGELYLAHQQGAGGAASLLGSPDARAADLVGLKAVTGNGGAPNETAAQFAQRWVGKFDGGQPVPGPTMQMPGAPAKGGTFGLAGPTATDAPSAPKVMPDPPSADTSSIDILRLLKMFEPTSGSGGQAPQPAPAAAPQRPQAPEPPRFDPTAFFALLNGRAR